MKSGFWILTAYFYFLEWLADSAVDVKVVIVVGGGGGRFTEEVALSRKNIILQRSKTLIC